MTDEMVKVKGVAARHLLGELIKTHPRVRYLKRGQRCSVSNLKVRRGADGSCRHEAHWRFTALKPRDAWMYPADSGVMCWRHLFNRGFYGNREEDAAFDRWLKRRGWRG